MMYIMSEAMPRSVCVGVIVIVKIDLEEQFNKNAKKLNMINRIKRKMTTNTSGHFYKQDIIYLPF